MHRFVAAALFPSLLVACGDSSSSGGAGGQAGTNSGAPTSAVTSSGSGSQTAATSASGIASTASASTGASTSSGGSQFAPISIELCQVLNDYRVSQGLSALPVSVSLMTVAAAHVADLEMHPDVATGECNLHSWSDTSALFGGCCYTPDHAEAQCMWDKPREITDYTGNGYEIAASGAPTPESALSAWQGSAPHHEVILNAGQWESYSPWPAMGCAIAGAYAVIWFGDAVDPLTL